MTEPKKNENIKTPRALGCYVNLQKPKPGMNGGEAKYGLMLLWDKKADLKKLTDDITRVAVEKWGPNAIPALKAGKLRNPLRDGDEKFEESGDPIYKGKVFLNASSTSRPAIVDTNLVPIDPAEAYSGCFFHAAVRFYPYDKNGNKGVGVGLQNLMLVAKGTRIDGRKTAEQDFKDFQPDVREGDEGVGDML